MMTLGGTLLLPVFAIVITRGYRSLAAVATTVLLIWLNLWWILLLLGSDALVTHIPAFLVVPKSTLTMVVGHVLAVVGGLLAFGLFSPERGSSVDLALRAVGRRDFRAAGEFWLEAGYSRRALRAFRRARVWGRAGEVARNLGRIDEAVAFYQKEGGESLAAAASVASRAGNEEQAQQLWLRYGTYLVQHNKVESAIEAFVRAGDARRAASAVEMAVSAKRLSTSSVDVALRAAREAGRPQLAAQVALAAGRLKEAGDFLLAAEQPLDAARIFESAGDFARAAEALQAGGQPEQAARLRAQRFRDEGRLEEALHLFETTGMNAESAGVLADLGRLPEAFERYREAGFLREAADVAQRLPDPAQAGELLAAIGEWDDAGMAWERAGNLLEAARCFERAGDLSRAEHLLGLGQHRLELASLLARMGRFEEGFGVLFEAGEMKAAWDLISATSASLPSLAEPLSKLAIWLAREVDVPTAIGAVQRATSDQPTRRELLPAFYTLAHLLEQHGDLKAAEAVWQKVVDFDYSYEDVAKRLQACKEHRQTIEGLHTSGKVSLEAAGIEVAGSDPASRYTIEKELGRGGMGVVYKAFDKRLGRAVAIKILNTRQHTPDAFKRFEREARAAAALSHPGIVHIYDFDRGFGSFFISMEFVAGPTLNQLLREEPIFVRQHLASFMRQIADAVAFAHASHVVHRDLKPANMILADRRQIKILDFGIARRLDDLDQSASGAAGTPYFMAPEQILGEAPDERTDIYALGVTFFQLATGTLPFTQGNVLKAHLEQPPPDPTEIAPDLDPAISQLVLACLAKDPNFRPRDGSALLAAVTGIAEDARLT
ncbi:MAG TPA: protein kinase [Thermoanaerobaculaceae bacterium]|nr:protein kinase [Thermoanaerobaculaceae bacterium]HPS77179.1 protein kinase [Thermoanaerobaculaceae bacterium]